MAGAVINHRPMCPGIVGLEGFTHGHDVVSVKVALEYLWNLGVSKRLQIILKKSKHAKMTPYSWAPAMERGCQTAMFFFVFRSS